MPRGKIKKEDLEKLRVTLPKTVKPAKGHTVTRATRTMKNERDYDRKRDKRVKDTDLE
jgi:hypothetical protein